jgi:DNA-binding NarL/FixJ family response regulator
MTAETSVDPNAGRIRCLVADDHPAIVDAVTRYLESIPEIDLVGVARDGHGALQMIRELRPEVCVLDIRMPGLGGIDVARSLEGDPDAPAVILYTGYSDRALLLEALDAGARGFLLKEAPLDDLLRAIRLAAEGKTYIDPALAGIVAGPEVADRLPTLTKREREVLRLLAERHAQRAGGEGALDLAPHRPHAREARDGEARGRYTHRSGRDRSPPVAHRLSRILQKEDAERSGRPMVRSPNRSIL